MLFVALLLPLMQGPFEVQEDLVVISKGRTHHGIVLLQNDEILVLGQGSKTKEFKRSRVKAVQGPRADYGAYISKLEWVYAPNSKAEDAVSLAQWCTQHRLFRDVDMHYWQALVKDPQNAVAHEQLGHRLREGEWQAPTGKGTWLSLEDLNDWHLDQSQPWLFYTAHFEVRANAKLAHALRAAAHVELLYARFFDELQTMAGFYELREPIHVRIYPNRYQGYPEVGDSTHGYFDQQTEIVTTWFEKGRAKNLVRITCHALQFRAVTERARARPSDYPGWLNEGIATHFDSSFTENDGLSDFYFGRMNLDWFRSHYAAKHPLSLDEVLNLPRTGFQNIKQANLAHAQAYSLLYFLLQNEDTAIMTGFKTYLEQVFQGKGGSSMFKKSFAKKTYKGLEKKWTDFVEKSVLRERKKLKQW
jgi:hypothetical protein